VKQNVFFFLEAVVMTTQHIYENYASVNARLIRGESIFLSWIENGLRIMNTSTAGSRRLHFPIIGLYAGYGTSHSWLWFIELFDRMGFLSLEFLDESDVKNGALKGLDVLIMSGGDTFAVAEALGERGAKALRWFIENGGLYIGSCAGAYLPMYSSKIHLNNFNFARVKITNLCKNFPKANRLAHKFCTEYGCDYIFHPVREAVQLKTTGNTPFAPLRSLTAPLYGGPGMMVESSCHILMHYEGFTKKTIFLAPEKMAGETLLGKAAAVRIALGKGRMHLFGPHLEHPHYPEANCFVADAIYWDGSCRQIDRPQSIKNGPATPLPNGKILIRDIKRELSNSRIVAAGLETGSALWKIGAKVYDLEKIRVYLESLWRRTRFLEKCPTLYAVSDQVQEMSNQADRTTVLLRRIKNFMDNGLDATEPASEVFINLRRLSSAFFHLYFQTRTQMVKCSFTGLSRSTIRHPRRDGNSLILTPPGLEVSNRRPLNGKRT